MAPPTALKEPGAISNGPWAKWVGVEWRGQWGGDGGTAMSRGQVTPCPPPTSLALMSLPGKEMFVYYKVACSHAYSFPKNLNFVTQITIRRDTESTDHFRGGVYQRKRGTSKRQEEAGAGRKNHRLTGVGFVFHKGLRHGPSETACLSSGPGSCDQTQQGLGNRRPGFPRGL